MAVKLREPKKKWRSSQKASFPYPVLVESVTGIPAHLSVQKTYHGCYNGDSIQVDNADDISTLYNMGFFGKGSLSRGCPRKARKNAFPEIIRERQWKYRQEWSVELDGTVASDMLPSVADTDSSHENQSSTSSNKPTAVTTEDVSASNPVDHAEKVDESVKACVPDSETDKQKRIAEQSSGNHVIVLSDSIAQNEDFISTLNPRLGKIPNALNESLILLPEEAFFLSFALGCLLVHDLTEEKVFSITELWALYQENDHRFVERYVVYHYFRSRNWIVKSGLKFGGDFLLYKEGPGIYHASYIVLCEAIHEEAYIDLSGRVMNWTKLMGLNRLAEASGKEIIFCHVIWPSDQPFSKLSSPSVISKFKVHETLVRRWQSSVERNTSESGERNNVSLNE